MGRLYRPVLGIVPITFAHIALPKTQWSHLVARKAGELEYHCVPRENRIPSLPVTHCVKLWTNYSPL